MPDFTFIHNPYSHIWVALAPHRSQRPDQIEKKTQVCPFCPGGEGDEQEVYRIPQNTSEPWKVRVVYNKFPFAPVHEVIIHSPSHTKNFDELPHEQVRLILEVYRQRYNTHKDKGNVVIFHNYGEASGASIAHPHTQLAVTPKEVDLDVMSLGMIDSQHVATDEFVVFSPQTSQWPDEVWIAPKNEGKTFGDTTDTELDDLAFVLKRLINILDLRHGEDFSFNFYITPWTNWYLRLIPRLKKPGGFEFATNVYVNTQDPSETIAFIQDHFMSPDLEKIKNIIFYSCVFACIPRSQRTASFLYLRSPLELILIAGSFPLLPQRFTVSTETRRSCATSLTVKRSGKLLIDSV
jgi:UDPglucose--hexose-1-phosphate uridylyltransferase